MIALIDMDLVCFRCSASAENEDFFVVEHRMNELLDNILTKTAVEGYKAFITGEDNFRKEIYPAYKANRTQPKPRHLEAARYFAIREFNAEAEHTLEADDLLGIHQTEDTVICSLDKDLLQIEGNHYQWAIATSKYSKPDTFITQTRLEGLRHFYQQCIKGDPSDNIKGIKGIGDVGAKKLLQGCTSEEEMFKVVKESYNNDEEFLMNAACLWILRQDREPYSERFERLNASL